MTYTTRGGETWETISRRVYGNEASAERLRMANPGKVEPFLAGEEIITPQSPQLNFSARRNQQDPREVVLYIDGAEYPFWTEIQITRSRDGISTAQFAAPFDANNANFRRIFEPFSYRDVVVTLKGAPLFTGTLMQVNPTLSELRVISASCYGRPGVLNDCCAAQMPESYEFNGRNLAEITASLCAPFGVSVVSLLEDDPVFEEIQIEPTKKVWGFLSELASQRNVVLRDNEDGALVIEQAKPKNGIAAALEEGQHPLLSVTPIFNAQEFYSHITAWTDTDFGDDGEKYTVKNPFSSVFRPYSFKVPDAEPGEAINAAQAKLGRMLANSAQYSASLSTIYDQNGQVFAPSAPVQVTAPSAMIYRPTVLECRSVRLSFTPATSVADVELVFPGSLAGKMPGELPWLG